MWVVNSSSSSQVPQPTQKLPSHDNWQGQPSSHNAKRHTSYQLQCLSFMGNEVERLLGNQHPRVGIHGNTPQHSDPLAFHQLCRRKKIRCIVHIDSRCLREGLWAQTPTGVRISLSFNHKVIFLRRGQKQHQPGASPNGQRSLDPAAHLLLPPAEWSAGMQGPSLLFHLHRPGEPRKQPWLELD